MLTYRKFNQLQVNEYLDADLASCMGTTKSILGYVFMLADGVISWESAK
jgi:hypothetical protein